MRMLLIDHFDSFTYNLKALFELNGAEVQVLRADVFFPADHFDALLFSPGPSSPDRAGSSLQYFERYRGQLPMFGVCLGMQVIGYQLGFPIKRAPLALHGKLDTIKVLPPSQLLAGLEGSFRAVRYHSLIVDAPSELVRARSASDDAPMVLEKPDEGLYGVQFHPESLLSEQGAAIVLNFFDCVRRFGAHRLKLGGNAAER